MDRVIVYTRFDGGVTLCRPSPRCIQWMGCGGRWNDKSRGYVDIQIERQIAAGHRPDAARRHAHAMQFGGQTTAEALEIIRDRDCAHLGTAFELWDVDEVPQDWWFRNAWRRSHNGGPISVDLKLARSIQFTKIRSAIDEEAKRRRDDLELFDIPVEVDLLMIRERILAARDDIELRSIWPAGVR